MKLKSRPQCGFSTCPYKKKISDKNGGNATGYKMCKYKKMERKEKPIRLNKR